jgi:hypothetical protein
MSDQPERIIAKRFPNGVVGARGDLTPKEGYSEYIRKDIADAAVKAERERCAERFANHDFIRMNQYVGGWRHDVYAVICNGDQP